MSGVDFASETKASAVSPQHANSKQTDDASTLAKDILALASYLRQRCSPSLTRLRHHLSIERYSPFPVPCLLDPAAAHQAIPLRWTLS
jgi:hypothetical protein